jgi:hypothetical protein
MYVVAQSKSGRVWAAYFFWVSMILNIEYRLTNVKCRSGARPVPLLHFTFVNRYSIFI